MKKIILLYFLTSLFFVLQAQNVRKIEIASTGCTFYSYCPDITFTNNYSFDSSMVYTGECTAKDGRNYGLICVQLKEKINDLDEAESLMISYFQEIKKVFQIIGARDMRNGFRLDNNIHTRGIAESWTDSEDDRWSVKGWTDGNYLVALYVWSRETPPEFESEAFQNSFRFP